MRRLGIVDLGSNTARLVVYNMEPGRWFRLMDQLRDPARLGEGLGGTGRLAAAAMDRAVAALELFADYARNSQVGRLETLATSALRDAANGPDFLRRVAPLDLEISVLSGEDEARLGVLAVANSFSVEDAWVMDLGGGSAQLSRMAGRDFRAGEAFPLGAVRLTESFLRADPPGSGHVRALESRVDELLGPRARAMAADDAPLIAMGGSVRNLARAIQKRIDYPLSDRLHGYFVTTEALSALTDELLSLDLAGRRRIRGVRPDRADIVVAAALVFRWLLRASGRPGLFISGYGLREGALFRHFLPTPHRVADVREFSVANLLAHYARAPRATQTVRRLAAELFEGLAPLHGLGDSERDLLHVAAELHDLGLAVSYYRHGRHGEYLVSAAPLNGYSHREQALIARMVRFLAKGEPSLGELAACCEPDDERVLGILVGCLRLAGHLDRPRGHRIRSLDVDLEAEPGAIRVEVASETSPTLELRGVEMAADLLGRTLGRPIRLRAVGSG